MFNCNWCGREVPPGEAFCPQCGHEYVASRTCPRCYMPVPINVRLCSNCGAFMETSVPEATSTGIIEAPVEGPRSYRAPVAGVPVPSAPKPKELWMKGPGVDPVYVGAMVAAVISMAFYWVPRLDIGLACLALIVAGFGYYRYYVARDMYEHLWVNIVASVLALIALLASIGWTMRVS